MSHDSAFSLHQYLSCFFLILRSVIVKPVLSLGQRLVGESLNMVSLIGGILENEDHDILSIEPVGVIVFHKYAPIT